MSKRLILAIALIALIAGYFLSSSRMPDLSAKAEMGDELQLEDPLAFDVMLQVDDTDPLYTKIAYTTVNWAVTNKKGMTFGICFGAAMLLLFSLITRRSFKNAYLNSAMGLLIGAPLGVCVNCATPIAQSVYAAGARLETALAAMMSSPTLNVIVLTMLISLFPPYIVLIKLGFTLAFILIGIPLISRFFAKNAGDLTVSDDSCPIGLKPEVIAPNERWHAALRWTGVAYFKNLWWLIKTAVPLMLLAGVLGAIVTHVVPWDFLVNLSEDRGGNVQKFLGPFLFAVVTTALVAGVGIFLPVPMTFDLIIVATLMGAGMPVHYAMALLFTLGIFSVYPFTIIWRDVSRRVALAITTSLVALGVIAGMVAWKYDKDLRAERVQMFMESLAESESGQVERKPPLDRPSASSAELAAMLAANQLAFTSQPPSQGLKIDSRPFGKRSAAGSTLFKKHPSSAWGFHEPYHFSLLNFQRPYSLGYPIASGDVNGDGWQDVALASPHGGLSLYYNVGGRFTRQDVAVSVLKDVHIGYVALVDLDQDGSLDLFVSAYRRGIHVIYGRNGQFVEENVHELPNLHMDQVLTPAASFGDIDGDGDLDIALGNWARWSGAKQSVNVILTNQGDHFDVMPLDEISGNTLSILFTDWNNDGKLDLIVGNEGPPTVFYRGDGTGKLTPVTRDDQVIPHSPKQTMSLAVSDIDNDLVPEIYLGQITGFATQSSRHVHSVLPEDLVNELTHEADKERLLSDTVAFQTVRRSLRARDGSMCDSIEDLDMRRECLATHAFEAAHWDHETGYCDFLPDRWQDLRAQCRSFFEPRLEYGKERYASALPQVLNRNIFLFSDGNGRFTDKAKAMDLEVVGWTWNAKFADVNNDEWVDLYVVNGIFLSKKRETNMLLLNQGGKKFVDATEEAGMLDHFPASSNTYIDIDNDGDLDIITVPTHGPMWVYENQSSKGNAIAFELRDDQGNCFGIGSKIIIHYGPGGQRHQVRELQIGGGFLSNDPLIAHFGLGEFGAVSRVEVLWPSGEKSNITTEFLAGATYRITRLAR